MSSPQVPGFVVRRLRTEDAAAGSCMARRWLAPLAVRKTPCYLAVTHPLSAFACPSCDPLPPSR